MHPFSIQRWMARGVFLACLCLPWLVMAQVQVSLDRSTIALGEAARLTVSLDGTDLNAYPEIPAVAGLAIEQGVVSTSMSIVNGVRSARLNIAYNVRPSKEGEFTIGPVRVKAGGRFHESQTLTLKVTPAKAPAASEEPNRLAFLQLMVPKSQVYAGEVFPLEVQLYFQSARGEVPQVKADGFSLSSPPQHIQNRVRLANAMYQQHIFRYAAKALKAGELPLGPAQCNLEVQIPVRDVDPAFGGLFQRYRTQPMTIRSEAATLKVLPLPEEGKPASFNGAVGKFSFQATAAKKEVAVGDPVIIQVEIGGMGAWDGVQLPPMNDWRDFKIYPPNSEFKPLDELGIQGVKRYELVVVPENSGVKEIPELAFSFFNTDSGKYETVKAPAMPLRVRASSGAPAQPTVTSGNVQPASDEPAVARDILHIKPHFGTAAGGGVSLGPVFWMFNALPLAAWAAIVFWRKRVEVLARNPRVQRARAVAQHEAEGLARLGELAAAGESKEFFDLLAKLLQERLGERLDLPAAVITEAVIEERLAPAGVEAKVRQELHALFHECNQARYAPVSDVAKLDALVERARKVLVGLREVKA